MVTSPAPRGRFSRAPRRSSARAGRASAFLLFLPSLALLAFALWQRGRSPIAPPERVAPTAPERTGFDGQVPGWAGTAELDGGIQIVARLERLHPVPERQRFDVNALHRVYPEPTARGGEPWRLVLTARGGEEGEEAPVAVTSLPDLRVAGLRPIASGAGAADASAPSDPLAALLAAPAGPLRSGETVSLVFWGDAPAADQPVALELPDVEAAFELEPSVREGSAATSSIAAVDARGVDGRGEEQR